MPETHSITKLKGKKMSDEKICPMFLVRTMSNIEIHAVKIISESPWHLWQAGILTLRNARGEKMLAC